MNGEETSNQEKMKFYQLLTKHTKSFLLYDQINKKFGDEIYQLHDNPIRAAVFFEIEKIKKYLKAFNDIEKLEGYLYVLSKKFYMIFLEKKTKKCRKIYLSKNLMQDLLKFIRCFRKFKIWVI